MEDPRLNKEDLCRVTTIGGTGIEWICINKVHAEVYQRRSSDKNHKKGDAIFSSAPKADQHYFVPRWPNRPKKESSCISSGSKTAAVSVSYHKTLS